MLTMNSVGTGQALGAFFAQFDNPQRLGLNLFTSPLRRTISSPLAGRTRCLT